jgi:hypothetical protein
MSVNQIFLFTRLDEFDVHLKWNAKAEIELDPIYVLLDRKMFANVLNEGTMFGEDVTPREYFTQTVKGFFTTTA